MSNVQLEKRSELSQIVEDMYDENPHLALGFSLYGRFHDHVSEIEKQLNSSQDYIVAAAIHLLREFNSKQSYEKVLGLLESDKVKGLEGNILITLLKLDFDKTFPYFEDYLLSVNKDEAWFVAYNILYDLIKDKKSKKQKEVDRILIKRADGELLLKDSYEKATRMIEEKDDED